MIAISSELKIVGSTKGNEPDKELLEQQLMHPSRITEFGKKTGLATMSKDNEPRVSFAAYLIVVLIAALVYGAYRYGEKSGYAEGREQGAQATKLEQLSEKLDNLEKEKQQDERDAERLKKAADELNKR